MIKVNYPVLVEGRYDKSRLSSVIDGAIFTTDGFVVFRDLAKRALIRRLAASGPVVILTDSDRAGAKIRSAVMNFCPGGTFINLYIPRVAGKESRKKKPSAEGILGVEGTDCAALEAVFVRAGLAGDGFEPKKSVLTRAELYSRGLLGKPDSASKRKKLLDLLGLPADLSVSSLCDAAGFAADPDSLRLALEKASQPDSSAPS